MKAVLLTPRTHAYILTAIKAAHLAMKAAQEQHTELKAAQVKMYTWNVT